MLGTLDNIVNAGIRFETDLRGVDKAQSKLDDLYEQMKQTGAGGLILSEGTEKANRSLNDQARSATTASGGLAGLQGQLASTRLAQEALEDSSGNVASALRSLDNDAQDMVISEVVGDLTGHLDDLDDAPDDFSLDYFVEGEDEVEALVRNISKLNDSDPAAGNFSIKEVVEGDGQFEPELIRKNHRQTDFNPEELLGGKRDPSLPDIESVNRMSDAIQTFRDADLGDVKFQRLFGDYSAGTSIEDFPLDPRSEDFPDDVDGVGAHVFDQINRNSDFTYFGELMGSDSNPEDFMDTPMLPSGYTRLIDNVDRDGSSLFGEQIERSLKNEGITTLDQLFRGSDDVLQSALDGTSLGDEYGITPDELRSNAVSSLRDYELEGKDMSEFSPDDRKRLDYGMNSVKEDRSSPKHPEGILRRIHGMTRGEDNEDLVDSANDLAFLMEDSEEINKALQDSTSLHEAYNTVADLDSDGLVKLNNWVEENRASLARSMADSRDLVERLGAVEDPEEFDRVIKSMGFDSDEEAETISNMMGDLNPSLLKGQGQGKGFPLTRETLGLRTMQEIMDTDPDSDRQDTLQSVLQSIYDPEEGIRTTLFDNDQLMKGGFYEGLRDELPDELTSPGGYNENVSDSDAARQITREFFSGKETDGLGIEDFLGEDSKNIGDVVGRAVNKFDFDDPEVLKKSSKTTEDFLPSLYEMYSSQLAPGLSTSARGSDNADITDLFPGQSVLDPVEDQNGQISPNYAGWMEDLEKSMRTIRRTQASSGTLRGGAYTGLLGGDGNKKGVFGALSEMYARSDHSDQRRVKMFNAGLEQLEDLYNRVNPLLKTTSFNLGPLNVNFEGVAVMVFKLTSLLGPLIVTLGGLAGAALTASAAMASFIGAGALGFLEDMEDSMAGVSNKSDAMSELASTLGEMANEAITPLQMARIGGDGNTAAQAFVELLRGGLQILNRVANIFAYVMELDEVGKQVERISNFLLNSDGDNKLAKQLGVLVTAVLPLINDVVIGILGNMGEFAEYAADIADTLGGEFIDTLGSLKPLLSLLTSYGAGFFTWALKIIAVLAELAQVLLLPFKLFTALISLIPGVSVTVNDLAYVIGALIGVMAVLGALGSWVAGQILLVAGAMTKMAGAATTATVSTYGLAASVAVLLSTLALATAAIYLFLNIVQDIKDLDPEFSIDFGMDLGVIIAKTAVLLGLLKALGATLTAYSASSIIGAIGISPGTIAVIGGLLKYGIASLATFLTGISAPMWLLLGIIAAIVITLADLVYYLATGKSFLFDWENIFKRIGMWAEKIIKAAKKVRTVTGRPMTSERFEGVEYKNALTGQSSTVGSGAISQSTSSTSSKDASFKIEVARETTDRELARKVQREIKKWWNA